MLKAFCDVCKKPIEGAGFLNAEVPLNGTGVKCHIVLVSPPEDFHVHQSCIFDSIRAAERRLKDVACEPKAEGGRG